MCFKKIKTARYLLKNRKWSVFNDRVQKNIKHLIVNFKNKKPFIYRTEMGFKFVCIPESSQSLQLYVGGWGEKLEVACARDWLLGGDDCLDLGANIGFYSAAFAEKVTPRGRVISVEASPKTAGHLKRMVRMLLLKEIFLEEVCVTDRRGHAEFMLSLDSPNESFQSLAVKREDEMFYRKENIKTVMVDDLIAKYRMNERVSLIKIDVEGVEPLVLKGASGLFNQETLPLFIVEITKDNLSWFNFTPEDVIKFFPTELFEIYNICFGTKPGSRILCRLNEMPVRDWPAHTNIVAIPKTGKYAVRKNRIKRYLS